MIRFCKTDKVKGILLFKNFIENLKGMMNNKIYLHHSHISGEISAHNLVRFDFFLLLKGLRAGVWKTRDRWKKSYQYKFCNHR